MTRASRRDHFLVCSNTFSFFVLWMGGATRASRRSHFLVLFLPRLASLFCGLDLTHWIDVGFFLSFLL